MKLKDRKRINNLPKYNGGKPVVDDSNPNYTIVDFTGNKQENLKNGQNTGLGSFVPYTAIAEYALGGIANAINAQQSADELIGQANVINSNNGNYSYEKTETYDQDKFMRDYDKQTGVSFLSNPIEGIGRLFGRAAQKRKMQEANRKIIANNSFNKDVAATSYLDRAQAMKYGNIEDQNLFNYKEGKDSVYTAYGKTNSKQNAWGNKGEWIYRPSTGDLQQITTGPNDTAKIRVNPEDIVFTNRYGISASVPYAAATGQLDKLVDFQKTLHQTGKLQSSGNVANPKFGNGTVGNIIHGIGSLAGLGQMFRAALDRPSRPNFHKSNRNLNEALKILAQNSISAKPLYDAINLKNAAINSNIRGLGGLNAGQQASLILANSMQSRNDLLNALIKSQEANNQYRTVYANALNQFGEADREAAYKSGIANYEAYRQAHNAKTKEFGVGLTNAYKGLQYLADNWNFWKQHADNMNIWQQQLNNDRNKVLNSFINTNYNLNDGQFIDGIYYDKQPQYSNRKDYT